MKQLHTCFGADPLFNSELLEPFRDVSIVVLGITEPVDFQSRPLKKLVLCMFFSSVTHHFYQGICFIVKFSNAAEAERSSGWQDPHVV